MPRITIDCYDDQHAAAGALDSLREVGLHPGDVAAAWPAAGTAPSGLEAVTPLELFEAPVESLGRVQFTGWLAEAARNACAAGPELDLRTLLRACAVEDADIDRAVRALAAAGGVVAIRARDSLA